jgi:hypothetical protein
MRVLVDLAEIEPTTSPATSGAGTVRVAIGAVEHR